MALRIYNSQSQKKEDFVPLTPGEVKMYVCGPTVYDLLHIGNFRGAVVFNLVRNWLEKQGYKVNYVYNYTDVDDKIIKRAQADGVPSEQISEKYIAEFKKDYDSLKLKPHTRNPKVTEFMDQIIEFIGDLIQSGKAYVVNGDVYYDVHAFPDYGKLSHKKLEDLESGYRIEVDDRKRHPADFALWKAAKPGEPKWKSPWSEGRPGWHIECSAMNRSLLGDTIDIHGGGMDLIFPHHENEVAQSEGATGKPFVRYWMHNNMIQFGNQKMSKSLGNIRTARSFILEFNGEILKYLLISPHYRSVSDFTESVLDQAINSLAKFYSALALAKKIIDMDLSLVPVPVSFQKVLDLANSNIEESLNDDFNTPEVIACFFEVTKAFNSTCRKPGKVTPEMKAVAEVYFHWLRSQGELMALFQEEPAAFLRLLDEMLLKKRGLDRLEIDKLVTDRNQARSEKNFAKADQIRDQLVQLGIAVQDSAQGTEWEVQK